MCHDLGRVRKLPLQMSPLLLFFGKGRKLSLREFQVLGVSDVEKEAE